MEFLTWKSVIGTLTGLGTLFLTVWKIVSSIRQTAIENEKKISDLKEEIAVQKAQINELRRDAERLQDVQDQLSNLMIKLLTGK